MTVRELDPELTAAVAALIDRDPTTGLAAVAAALASPVGLTSAQLGAGLDVLARVVGRPEPGPRARWWAGGPVPSARM